MLLKQENTLYISARRASHLLSNCCLLPSLGMQCYTDNNWWHLLASVSSCVASQKSRILDVFDGGYRSWSIGLQMFDLFRILKLSYVGIIFGIDWISLYTCWLHNTVYKYLYNITSSWWIMASVYPSSTHCWYLVLCSWTIASLPTTSVYLKRAGSSLAIYKRLAVIHLMHVSGIG